MNVETEYPFQTFGGGGRAKEEEKNLLYKFAIEKKNVLEIFHELRKSIPASSFSHWLTLLTRRDTKRSTSI